MLCVVVGEIIGNVVCCGRKGDRKCYELCY
jgi:hypothetical protein